MYKKFICDRHEITITQLWRYDLQRYDLQLYNLQHGTNVSCRCRKMGRSCAIRSKNNSDCLKWVLFNPSTSPRNETQGFDDDQTVENVKKITTHCGFNRLELYNLIPKVASNIDDLRELSREEKFSKLFGFPKSCRYKSGDCQYSALNKLKGSDPIVFAWGALRGDARWAFSRGLEYLQRIFPDNSNDHRFYYLGKVGGDHPRHPGRNFLAKPWKLEEFELQPYMQKYLSKKFNRIQTKLPH